MDFIIWSIFSLYHAGRIIRACRFILVAYMAHVKDVIITENCQIIGMIHVSCALVGVLWFGYKNFSFYSFDCLEPIGLTISSMTLFYVSRSSRYA